MTIRTFFSRNSRVRLVSDYPNAPRSHPHSPNNSAVSRSLLRMGTTYSVDQLFGSIADGSRGRSLTVQGMRGVFNSNQFRYAGDPDPGTFPSRGEDQPAPPVVETPLPEHLITRLPDADRVFNINRQVPPPVFVQDTSPDEVTPDTGIVDRIRAFNHSWVETSTQPVTPTPQDTGPLSVGPPPGGFQVGDLVRRARDGSWGDVRLGDDYTVTILCDDGEHMMVSGMSGDGGTAMRHFDLISRGGHTLQPGTAAAPLVGAEKRYVFLYYTDEGRPVVSQPFISRSACEELARSSSGGYTTHIMETTSVFQETTVEV